MRKDVLSAYPQLDPNTVHVVRNGVDTEEFHPVDETDVCARIGMDPQAPSVVFVGRITRQKGLVHLVRAALELDPDTQVVLLAGAADTPQIAAEFDAAFTDLKKARKAPVLRVEQMLPRADVRQVLSAATVFACPSVYEPLGIVNLEAMACATPVVASAVGGIPEVVVDGQTGWLVDGVPTDSATPDEVARFRSSFAERINMLTRDAQLAAQFGRAGRQRCIDEFSWARIADQTLQVYRQAAIHHLAPEL